MDFCSRLVVLNMLYQVRGGRTTSMILLSEIEIMYVLLSNHNYLLQVFLKLYVQRSK